VASITRNLTVPADPAVPALLAVCAAGRRPCAGIGPSAVSPRLSAILPTLPGPARPARVCAAGSRFMSALSARWITGEFEQLRQV